MRFAWMLCILRMLRESWYFGGGFFGKDFEDRKTDFVIT